MTIEVLRKKVAEVFKKLGPNTASKYEKAIYNMSVRIAKDSGSKIVPVYSKIAYDKAGQILGAKTRLDRHRIFNDLKNDVEDWDSCIYDAERKEYYKMMDRSVQKLTSLKGVYKCTWKGCKSDEFFVWSAQTRSGDEAMTQYRQCAICNKRRKE